jgi:hypothetical protein
VRYVLYIYDISGLRDQTETVRPYRVNGLCAAVVALVRNG